MESTGHLGVSDDTDASSSTEDESLCILVDLNDQLEAAKKAGTAIVVSGLPPCVTAPGAFITSDCVQPPDYRGARAKSEGNVRWEMCCRMNKDGRHAKTLIF